MKRSVLYGMTALTVLIASSTWAESVYRCSDGSFTNKAERQCHPYEPKEIGRVQSEADSEHQPFASVTLFDERSKKAWNVNRTPAEVVRAASPAAH
jgi:hypothetical protein